VSACNSLGSVVGATEDGGAAAAEFDVGVGVGVGVVGTVGVDVVRVDVVRAVCIGDEVGAAATGSVASTAVRDDDRDAAGNDSSGAETKPVPRIVEPPLFLDLF
jgi:hypothetical protein